MGQGWKERGFLALLAALAHPHANVGDEEHAEEAPGDDIECLAHEWSPAAKLNGISIG